MMCCDVPCCHVISYYGVSKIVQHMKRIVLPYTIPRVYNTTGKTNIHTQNINKTKLRDSRCDHARLECTSMHYARLYDSICVMVTHAIACICVLVIITIRLRVATPISAPPNRCSSPPMLCDQRQCWAIHIMPEVLSPTS